MGWRVKRSSEWVCPETLKAQRCSVSFSSWTLSHLQCSFSFSLLLLHSKRTMEGALYCCLF